MQLSRLAAHCFACQFAGRREILFGGSRQCQVMNRRGLHTVLLRFFGPYLFRKLPLPAVCRHVSFADRFTAWQQIRNRQFDFAFLHRRRKQPIRIADRCRDQQRVQVRHQTQIGVTLDSRFAIHHHRQAASESAVAKFRQTPRNRKLFSCAFRLASTFLDHLASQHVIEPFATRG